MSNLKNVRLYSVTYNDCYGNGDQTSLECVTNDFEKWFAEHNEDRENDGEEPEDREEFTVEELSVALY